MFRGSEENACLVCRKWTSIRGPSGMRPPVPQVTHKTDLPDPHRPWVAIGPGRWDLADVSWVVRSFSNARQFCGCAWVGRSGVRDRNVQPRKTADCKRQHPASTTAGRGVAVCPLLFRIRIPVLFGTRAPQGSRRPVDSTSPSTARVSCITRACPPTPRRRLRALEPPARSSPPISNDSPPHPPSQPRPTGAWAVRGRVSLCAASS